MNKRRILFVLVICALLGFMAIPNASADTTTEQYFEGTITEYHNYYDEIGNPVPEATIEFDLVEGLVEIEIGWKPFKCDMDGYMFFEGIWVPWWEMNLNTFGTPERDIYYAQAGHYTLDLEFWVEQIYEPWNIEPPEELDLMLLFPPSSAVPFNPCQWTIRHGCFQSCSYFVCQAEDDAISINVVFV